MANFDAQSGASSGHQVYYDLKVNTRDSRHFNAAVYIADKPEADWLVRQMSAALKNVPATNLNL